MVVIEDGPLPENKKEVVYVYCAEVARELLLKEGHKIELNCVKQEQRVCGSYGDIDKFYNGQPPMYEAADRLDDLNTR